jgi:AcrR family transcriptional regulator
MIDSQSTHHRSYQNMPPITKDPQIRRSELINAAEELILIHGYDQIAVSDIVKKVGVAQGTFYHYFKSKDDVINAIIDRTIIEIKDGVENVASKKDQNAIEKILGFFSFFNNLGQNWKKLVDYFHEERNAHFHLKFEQRVPGIFKEYALKMEGK